MRKFGDCVFCDGSGKCEECNGTGVNPHMRSSDAACPHCSGNGKCPECSGSGLSPIGRPHKGSVVKYALLVVGVMLGLFALMTVPNRIVATIAWVVWAVLLYALFHWDSQRKKSTPPSRF
jgi:hypothetical protein